MRGGGSAFPCLAHPRAYIVHEGPNIVHGCPYMMYGHLYIAHKHRTSCTSTRT